MTEVNPITTPESPLTSIKLFSPNSKDPLLESVPYANLLGTWHVVASTLPLWKDKKNVKITYKSIEGSPQTTFDDLVEYNKVGDAVGKAPSTVKGVDRLEEGSSAGWKWRGKGLLTPITSRWQLLGFNLPSSPSSIDSPEWVVTYFASTLFTPSGLDIYSRTKDGLTDDMVVQLINKLGGLGGEVSGLVKDNGMFRVAHD